MLEVEIGANDLVPPLPGEHGCGQVWMYGEYWQIDDDGEIAERMEIH